MMLIESNWRKKRAMRVDMNKENLYIITLLTGIRSDLVHPLSVCPHIRPLAWCLLLWPFRFVAFWSGSALS